MVDPIVNLPGNLFEGTIYPVGPLYLTIVSGNGEALPDLTAKAVVITQAFNKRTVLPDNRQPTLTRIGTDGMTYALQYDNVTPLYEDATIIANSGFYIEFAVANGEVVMRGNFKFSLKTTENDTDFDTLSIIIQQQSYFLTVSFPLRSGTFGGGIVYVDTIEEAHEAPFCIVFVYETNVAYLHLSQPEPHLRAMFTEDDENNLIYPL